MSLETDLLIVGTGIAGLSCALHFAESNPNRSVTLISKRNIFETNTRYAQGGIAVVTDFLRDSFPKHKSDTLRARQALFCGSQQGCHGLPWGKCRNHVVTK